MLAEQDGYGRFRTCMSCGAEVNDGPTAEPLPDVPGSRRARQPSHGKIWL